jgi:hypothetical protein
VEQVDTKVFKVKLVFKDPWVHRAIVEHLEKKAFLDHQVKLATKDEVEDPVHRVVQVVLVNRDFLVSLGNLVSRAYRDFKAKAALVVIRVHQGAADEVGGSKSGV